MSFRDSSVVIVIFQAAAFFLLGPHFATADEPARVVLKTGRRPVAVYQAAFRPSSNPETPWFGRSGFIDSMFTPSGMVVTEGFPQGGHEHQHALMFAWTSARIGDRPVDFWNSAKQEGKISHRSLTSYRAAGLTAELIHTSGEQTVIEETWQIQVVPHSEVNVIDLTSIQTCVLERPLVIDQYHYGGMCVRGRNEWMKSNATLVTDDGLSREDGNHSRPRYVIMHGMIEGKPCGIAAISHPTNFRSPQPVRLHGSNPYFCFAPMVLGKFELSPGKPYQSRFRFIAFDGPPPIEVIDQLHEDFGN